VIPLALAAVVLAGLAAAGEPPRATLTATSVTGPTGWYNRTTSGSSGVELHVEVVDPLENLQIQCADGDAVVLDIAATSATFTIGDGRHDVACTALRPDGATTLVTGTFLVDQEPPALDPAVTPDPVRRGADARARPRASDATSGVASSSCQDPSTRRRGRQHVTCTATDVAGNVAYERVAYRVRRAQAPR
jgi:hypothetical protein